MTRDVIFLLPNSVNPKDLRIICLNLSLQSLTFGAATERSQKTRFISPNIRQIHACLSQLEATQLSQELKILKNLYHNPDHLDAKNTLDKYARCLRNINTPDSDINIYTRINSFRHDSM